MHQDGRTTGRPQASWVMGRSARWHDPDLLAEIAAEELFGRRRELPSLSAAAVGLACLPAGPDTVPFAPIVVGRVVSLLARSLRSLRRG